MPYDVILYIFEQLSLCAKTCLSVTCKNLYSALKEQHPEPISLFQEVDCPGKCEQHWNETTPRHSDSERLGIYLQNWSGLKMNYRLCKFSGIQLWVFVRRGIHGQKVEQRFRDYQLSLSDNIFLRGPRLPNPFSKGEEWCAEAVAVINTDLTKPGGNRQPGDCQAWKDYWRLYSVFREKGEELEQID
jgi:hypothetical protein